MYPEPTFNWILDVCFFGYHIASRARFVNKLDITATQNKSWAAQTLGNEKSFSTQSELSC